MRQKLQYRRKITLFRTPARVKYLYYVFCGHKTKVAGAGVFQNLVMHAHKYYNGNF